MSAAGFNSEDLMRLGQMLLDPTLARPVKVYVDKKDGRIWRLVDPMSPTEKMPVIMEWSEEHKKKREIEGEVVEYYEEETETEEVPKKKIIELLCTIEDAHHAFDQPEVIADTRVGPDKQTVGDALRDNPSAHVLICGHADRCHRSGYDLDIKEASGVLIPTQLNRGYNHTLTNERAAAVQQAYVAQNTAIPGQIRTACQSPDTIRVRRLGCSNFCPVNGPNGPERDCRSPGNAQNRRSELYILPDMDHFKKYMQKDAKVKALREEVVRRGGVWAESGPFPCRTGRIEICNLLSTVQGSSGREEPYLGANGQPVCRYYERLQQLLGQEVEVQDGTTEETRTRKVKKTKKTPDKQVVETRIVGGYEPPEGEHYGFDLRELIGKKIKPGVAVAPEVAVAPNRAEDPQDYNLIKPGPIRVVKMDIGFWGDARVRDSSRAAGFYRKPARSFGAIEGPFVFLCFFETRDSADAPDSFSPKMPDVDPDLNPLMHRFCEKAVDLGFSVRIEKKAVAEAGPDDQKLLLLFPDFHLPRKFDEKDAVYETEDKCVRSTQMLKSLLLDSLRKDYQLSGKRTPWLSAHDRLKCLEFFEHGAERLKLPHYSSGRTMSNPFAVAGDGLLEKFGDAAQKTMQTIQQVGYFLFEFTRDDLRREITRFGGVYRDRGRGFTKDALANWFYGFESDRQVFDAPQSGGPDASQLIPPPVQDIGERLGVLDGEDSGRAPDNLNTLINPAPARDLLRILKVIQESNDEHDGYIEVIHTGDMHEMWINRRFLFTDLEETEPKSQRPGLIDDVEGDPGSFTRKISGGTKWVFQTLLGGVNAQAFDLWHRRETRKDAAFPTGMTEAEDSVTIDPAKPIIGTGSSNGNGNGNGNDKLPGIRVSAPLEKNREGPVSLDTLRGRGYIAAETAERAKRIEAFEAPIGGDEDRELLGANVKGDLGLWNKAVIEGFEAVDAQMLYGNHDCYRGLGGGSAAAGYESRRNLWVEHGHRFEDSNVDGQAFGAAMTNMVYDFLEIPLYEGLLDEFALHREQDMYQPGVAAWFLIGEFGQKEIAEQQKKLGGRQTVERFRISVNGHTHAPDLVVLEFVFAPKESTALAHFNTVAAAAKLLASLIPKIIEWVSKYKDREDSFSDWASDVFGDPIKAAGERAVDNAAAFGAGIGACLKKSDDFLKKFATDKLNEEWERTQDAASANVGAVRDRAEEKARDAAERGRRAVNEARDTFGF